MGVCLSNQITYLGRYVTLEWLGFASCEETDT